MKDNQITIRRATSADSEQLWTLMKELAMFEHYIDSFAITPDIVRESGFLKSPQDFHCLVAADGAHIAGMFVWYFLPYTAQNRPAVYMKELYIDSAYRGQKIGEQLMESLKEEALHYNCRQIKWTVAPWNTAAQRFYNKLDARENRDWLHYEWEIE